MEPNISSGEIGSLFWEASRSSPRLGSHFDGKRHSNQQGRGVVGWKSNYVTGCIRWFLSRKFVCLGWPKLRSHATGDRML